MMMMKKTFWMMTAAFVVAAPAMATSWDEYRVVLKDGSWLTAREKPELGDDQPLALLRLPSGLMTLEEAQQIDWQKTRAWNFQAIYLHDVIAGSDRVVPLEGEKGYGHVILNVDEDSTDEESRLAMLADPMAPPDPVTEMRNRVQDLAEQIGALKDRKSVLEKAAAVSHSPRKAVELRREAEDLEGEIRALRSEQAQLILKLPRLAP